MDYTSSSYRGIPISNSSLRSSSRLVKKEPSSTHPSGDVDSKMSQNMDLTICYIKECLEIDKKMIENNTGMPKSITSEILLVPALLKNSQLYPVKRLYEEYVQRQSLRLPLKSIISWEIILLNSYFFHMGFYLRLIEKIKPHELGHLNKTANADIEEMVSRPIECIRQKHKNRILQISKTFRLAYEIEDTLSKHIKSHCV